MLTVGTDAYCSRADADMFHEKHPHNAAWEDAAPDQRDRLLRLATRLIDDHFDWCGWPRNTNGQALAWPRYGLRELHGWQLLDSDAIPERIRDATAQLALALAAEDRTEDQVLADLDIRASGDTQFGGGARRKPIPDVVADMIPGHWGMLRAGSSGVGSVRLARG